MKFDIHYPESHMFQDYLDQVQILRQHRTKIVRQMRSQIFCQIAQKRRRHTVVRQGVFVRYEVKYASI